MQTGLCRKLRHLSINSGIVLSENDLYVSGHEADGTAKYWKNDVLVNVTDGTRSAASFAIFVLGSDVYIAGLKDAAAVHSSAKYWKNGVPVRLSDRSDLVNVTGISVSGNDVYVIEYEFNPVQEVYNDKYWKNGVPVNVSDGIVPVSAGSMVLKQR